MIKVLVVEDSAVSQQLLVHLLGKDPGIRVIGTAGNGEEAIAFLAKQKPDVITMDIHMPVLDGIEATRKIMETEPVPIVIVSAVWNPAEVATTFRAMEAGAVALVEKPAGLGHPESQEQARALVQTVKNMAEVRVIRRRGLRPGAGAGGEGAAPPATRPNLRNIQVIVVGASTGGPPALRNLLAHLPPEMTVPILIVQHIAAGFLPGLADWLSAAGRPVEIAKQGTVPERGHVYLAPDGFQMGLDEHGIITLSSSPIENGLRPSVSYLFRSAAEVHGDRAVGIMLTGMGRDGAQELKLLHDRGAITFAQDRESSVVHGMPGAAIRLDAATYILSPDKIGGTVGALLRADQA